MARSYANVATAIWRDDEFRALSLPGQHFYFMLITQPDISAVGVLPLALTRWASRTDGITRSHLHGPMEELERAGFIAVDEETEELLVRSFVRWDKGYANPNRQPSIRDAADAVESPTLRRTIGREFARLDVPRKCVPDSYPQVEWPSDSHPDRHPDSHPDSGPDSHPGISRSVVTKDVEEPHSTTREPQPALRTPPPSPTGGRARGDANAADGEHPPSRCPDHIRDLSPPNCGACGDYRRAGVLWDAERAAANASARSRAAHEHAEMVRAEIDGCGMCDPDGRLASGQLCRHDPGNTDRTKQGAAAVRAVIGGRPRARTPDRPADATAEASERRRQAEADHQARLASGEAP